MNYLDLNAQIRIISALVEGCSIRSTERLTGIHRDTVMRVGYRIGNACSNLHDRLFQSLPTTTIQIDEAWSFVGKKQKNCKATDGQDVGDQYIFIAMDADSKAILTYHMGKRDAVNTQVFIRDLRSRLTRIPQITSDGFLSYASAIDDAFGVDVHYAQVQKEYVGGQAYKPDKRYSPGFCVAVTKETICGRPDPSRITTAHIERQNLSLRMGQRRFTRLTNAYSRKLEHHIAAFSLYAVHYNLCRVHNTLRITPAMEMGIANHIWTIEDLICELGADRPVSKINPLMQGMEIN